MIRYFARAGLAAAAMFAGIGMAQQQSAPVPALSPAAASPIAAASPGQRPLTKADVDSWLDGYMPYALRRGDIAGAVVVVVKDGQVLTQRGFGHADIAKRTAVDPDRTMFRIASVSKLFTWTAVMQQVEAGRIDLDADVNRYLDFTIPLRDGKPVTMRNLMTHTAGFEEHGKDIMFDDPNNLMSLETFVKRSLPVRIYAPGTTPAYSNYGTALAAYIVERVAKTPYADYVERHIFGPLGMTHSTSRQQTPKPLAPFFASGYLKASAGAAKFEYMGAPPAGGIAASGADMGRFMIAHLQQGTGLMKPETARMMHDTPLTLMPPLNRMELGFFETNLNGRQIIGHLGDTLQFHTGLHLFINENVGFYVSVNSMGKENAAGPVRRALFEDFTDRYFPSQGPADGRVDAATAAEHVRLMVGNWLNSRRSETNFRAFLNLLNQYRISLDDKGGLVLPFVRGLDEKPVKWVEIAPFVWHNPDGHERLAAKLVDGRVVRWSVDSSSPFMAFDRVPARLSSAWLLPAFYASLAVLLLSVLQWPVAALVRRRYKAPLALSRPALQAYRGVRIGAALVPVLLGLWLVGFSLTETGAYAWLLWLLQIGGLVVFVGAVLLAAWNLRFALSEKRSWFSRLWSVLLLLAMLLVLYVAWSFGLLAMTVQY